MEAGSRQKLKFCGKITAAIKNTRAVSLSRHGYLFTFFFFFPKQIYHDERFRLTTRRMNLSVERKIDSFNINTTFLSRCQRMQSNV